MLETTAPAIDAAADVAPAAPDGDSSSDDERDAKKTKAADKAAEGRCYSVIDFLSIAIGGEHSAWRHPVVIIMIFFTLIGCCYGIAQNWQKTVASRKNPALRTETIGPIASFPKWAAVVCTDSTFGPVMHATQQPWNLLLAPAPPPVDEAALAAALGGKDGTPSAPAGPAIDKSLALNAAARRTADRRTARVAHEAAAMKRSLDAAAAAAPESSPGRRLAQWSSSPPYYSSPPYTSTSSSDWYYSSTSSSTSTSTDDGYYSATVFGVCDAFNASNTNSARQNTEPCTINAPVASDGNLFTSCWLYVQACGCHGDTYMRFLHASSSTQLGVMDDGGSSSDGCGNYNDGLCSAGAVDVTAGALDSDGEAAAITINQGCYSSGECRGQTFYFYSCVSSSDAQQPQIDIGGLDNLSGGDGSGDTPTAQELTVDAQSGTAYAYGYCDPYNARNTNYASSGTSTCAINFTPQEEYGNCTAYIYACGCDGDTYLRLSTVTGASVATFDDDRLSWCAASDWACSSGSVPLLAGSGRYDVQEGCFSSGTCGGAVNWYVQCTSSSSGEDSSNDSSSYSWYSLLGELGGLNTTTTDAGYQYTSSDTATGANVTSTYGSCEPFYNYGGSGMAACDVSLPAMSVASTCEVLAQSCYCTGDTVLTFPSLGGVTVDDDSLQYCPTNQGRCSTGFVSTNLTASRSSTRLPMQQTCYGGSASCSGSTYWQVRCWPVGASVSSAAPAASSPPTAVTTEFAVDTDYTNQVAPGADAVGVYFTVSIAGVDRAQLERNETLFLQLVAASLGVPVSRVTKVTPFTTVISATPAAGHHHHRKALTASTQTVQISLSVVATSNALANQMLAALTGGALNATLTPVLPPAATVALTGTPELGAAIFKPVIRLGTFNTSTTAPMKPGELVFGTYQQSQCLQVRTSSLFLEADSHTLNQSAAAFSLDVVSSIDSALAIGFYAVDEGEASLVRATNFFILRQNASVEAVPRVSAAKRKNLKPYRASVKQLVAITSGDEDALYQNPIWDFKIQRLEIQRDVDVSSGVSRDGTKSTNTKTTTLQFHPFFFDFYVPVTEQYFVFDDVQAFTATVTYITYFLTVVPLILHVPKALRFIRHHCCCCLRKKAAPSDKVAD